MEMPQIRCPNCGTTINLESRKEADIDLILRTLKSEPRSFTELLKATHLPRKTLCIRLKELINSQAVVKDGGYRLNGSSEVWKKMNLNKPRLIRGNQNAIILATLVGFLVIALFAVPFASTHINYFTVKIKVYGAVDLYGWQTEVVFDPNLLVVLNVQSGEFLSRNALTVNASSYDDPNFDSILNYVGNYIFVFNTRLGRPNVYGRLLMGGTFFGNAQGVSGDGVLATVTFGIRKEAGTLSPYLANTMLLNAQVENTAGTLAIEK